MATARKWALITGVSEGGLGDALTQELLSRNVNVIATAVDSSLLHYLPKETDRLEQVELDVTSADSIAAAVAEVRRITNDKLDILINNAGYGYMMPLMDAKIEEVRRNYDVNVIGLLAVTQAFFPLLRAAKGMVVNQSSIAGLPGVSQPYIGTYGSSKAALSQMSDVMRIELAPFGVKVVTLVTGDVGTGFWRNNRGADIGIPDSSPYAPIKTTVEAMMRGETNPPGQHSREKWAKAVVNDLLQRNSPRYIRRGYLATLMVWASWLVPSWLFEYGFSQTSGLHKLASMS